MSTGGWYTLPRMEYPKDSRVYEVETAEGELVFSFWDGEMFSYPSINPGYAQELRGVYCPDFVPIKWRPIQN